LKYKKPGAEKWIKENVPKETINKAKTGFGKVKSTAKKILKNVRK